MTASLRIAGATVALSILLLPGRLDAQQAQGRGEGVYLIPTISLGASYDDNLFLSASDADETFFGRSSQGLALELVGKTVKVTLGYTFDSELFPERLNELTDLSSRQKARAEIAYKGARSRFDLNAGYLSTLSPQELLVPTGLDLGRRPSESYTGSVGFGRHISRRSSWTIDYDFSQLSLGDASLSSSTSHSLSTGVTHEFSTRTAFTLQYGAQRYLYDGMPGALTAQESTAMSHLVYVGFKRQVGARTTLDLSAGPRATRLDAPFDSRDWQLSFDATASIAHRGENVDFSIAASRGQQQVFGLSGFTRTESVSIGLSYLPHPRVRLSVSPGVYRNHRGDAELWVYSAGVASSVQFSEWLSFRAGYTYSLQDGRYLFFRSGLLGGADELQHNVFSLSLIFGYPFRL